MLQIIVSGKVEKLSEVDRDNNTQTTYVAELHEKVWDGQKNVIRVWDIKLDKYTGERLKKAMVQIKYFGFNCDLLQFAYEQQGKDGRLVVWITVRGRDFFTL